MDALLALTCLLFLCVAAMGVALCLLVHSSGSDRELMAKTLERFADRIVLEKDEQIERKRIEAQVDIGQDYMAAQRDIAKTHSRRHVNNGQAERSKADISVPMDDPE